jgi:hypothetical protein
MSATVAATTFRPTRSYTNTRDVTVQDDQHALLDIEPARDEV